MASRLVAKKYLVSIGLGDRRWSERECLEALISRDKQHRMRLEDVARPDSLTWFGRLLWWMFGRWL